MLNYRWVTDSVIIPEHIMKPAKWEKMRLFSTRTPIYCTLHHGIHGWQWHVLSGNYFLVFVDDGGVCRHMVTIYLNELNLVSEKRNHSLDNNDIRLDSHKNCNEEISKTTTNSTNERANRVRLLWYNMLYVIYIAPRLKCHSDICSNLKSSSMVFILDLEFPKERELFD